MPRRQPPEERRVDADGIVHVRERRSGFDPVLGAAVFVGALGAVLAIIAAELWPRAVPVPEQRAAAEVRRQTGEPPPSGQREAAVARAQAGTLAADDEAQNERAFGVEVDLGEEDPDVQPDEPSGMSLFPPRGTKPIKVGIVVPEDFPLPPGFMRHHQTTDDGQLLPGILVFHPDHQPVDAQGKPIEVGPDRIVPPELAPPGLPIELLEVPGPPEDDAE